jgi:hypothetical protein
MSDTHHRKHLSKGERSKRGGRMDPELRNERVRPLKTPKQKRVNDRAKLRKEYLT